MPSDTVLCLENNRFEVTLDWKKSTGETVLDTERGVLRTYTNPQGHPANAVAGTSTFPTCP